ncbi:MAG: 1-acyl-sn-glycerol-3-phosphate acyltransferase [Rhodospirillaceae bacterium]|nr:1-acyl-sn-glycerol-3-phosphate acyltransferase [Rhodospirillaceae bacterium]
MTNPLDARPGPVTWIRSALYALAFSLWAVIACLGLLPFLIRRAWTPTAVRIWNTGNVVLARIFAGVGCRVEGLEHLPAEPCIIASQHQSSYETFRVFVDLRDPVLVLKQELIRIPFIGWYMLRGGMVSIDRAGGAAAMRKTMRATKAALASGRHVVIFPEGTRAPPGVVLPFRPGIAALYLHCNVPVIPVALDSGWFWGKFRLLKRPGHITVRFLPPLPPGLGKDEMLERLHAAISEASRSLPAGVPPAG